MSLYTHVETHRSMVFDEVRNRAYAQAIRRAARPGRTVLDLGAGLGIHGLLAAAEGAHVILLDSSPVVEIAAEVARHNGYFDRVTVIRRQLEEVDLPGPVDAIVSVFTGHFLLTEDLLPYLFVARDRFLKPGGVMIPDVGVMKAMLVNAGPYYEKHVARWSEPTLGLSFEPVRRFVSNGVFYHHAAEMQCRALGPPGVVQELDFMTATRADCHANVTLEVESAAVCHGVCGWFDIRLGETWLSTAPDAPATHWLQAFFPLDPPMELQAGERVALQIDHPQFGEWTWTVAAQSGRQRHSTFQKRVPDLAFLKGQSADSTTGLGQWGEVAWFVLEAMKRREPISAILQRTRAQFPELSERNLQFDQRVRSMIRDWRSAG